MIDVRDLVKCYRRTRAVDGLTFRAPPGAVTGFLGPNGAGKSSTLRVLLGLAAPTDGTALVNGSRYHQLRHPLHQVGSCLDPTEVHPGRSASAHLRALARSNRIGTGRVGDVLAAVGLAEVAHRRVGGFSTGMKQRLGIAAALLGDPAVIVLDEPVNGLDPDGVRWIRGLLRGLAGEGRTVLLSSHLIGELELTADRLVVIGRGRLLCETTVSQLVDRYPVGTPGRLEQAYLELTAGAGQFLPGGEPR